MAKQSDPLKHHHFDPKDLLSLGWKDPISLEISRSDGWHSEWCDYHEATFPIGADEVGHIFIPDSALKLLKELSLSQSDPALDLLMSMREDEVGKALALALKEIKEKGLI
jgi:hypothetical protein